MGKSSSAGKNGRDSNPKSRGVKKFGGEFVTAGSILIRQCGTKYYPGLNTGIGKDYTIYAKIDGKVTFPKSRVVSVVAKS